MHSASPNPSKAPKDQSVVIRPNVEGTTNILRASQAAGVKRVVVTCSIASVFMKTEANHKSKYDENDWSDIDMCLGIFHKSTYQKETAVWKYINEEQA